MKIRMAVVLLAIIGLTPAIHAQSPGSNFALTDVSRDADALRLTLVATRSTAFAAIVALVDGSGSLLQPAQWRSQIDPGAATVFTFDDLAAETATVRIEYTFYTNDTTRHVDTISFHVPPRAEDDIDARLDVVAVEAFGERGVKLTLRSIGNATAGPTNVSLEDKDGANLGTPLARAIGPLAPQAEEKAVFELPTSATTFVVKMAHQNRTESRTLHAPERTSADLLGVLEARGTDAGNATLVVLPAPSTPLDLSIRDDKGNTIGDPLFRHVPATETATPVEISFKLPAGTRNIVVHAQGSERSHDVALRLSSAEGSHSGVRLTTDLPSREAEPGATVNYALQLENDGSERLVTLKADGLPAGYDVRFSVDGSTVTSLQAPEGETRSVVASVRVPESATRDAGRTLHLNVTVLEAGDAIADLSLALDVRGQGRLELQGSNWFTVAQAGSPQTVEVSLKNTGSAPVFGAELSATAPTGWAVGFDPARFERIDPGVAKTVKVTLTPSLDAGAGRYVVDVGADTQDASARPRSLSVELQAPSSSKWPWVLAGGAAVVGAVALTIRMRRR